DAKGLSGTEIGILLGIGPWARFAVNPLVGPLADRRGVIRELIIGASLLAGVGLGLYLAADAFAALLLAGVLVGLGTAPIVPLGDALAIRFAAAGLIDYSRVRLCGSIAFIGTTLLGGAILAELGVISIPISALALWVLGIGVAAAPPAPPPGPAEEAAARKTGPRPPPAPPRGRGAGVPARQTPAILVVAACWGVARAFLAATCLVLSHAVVYHFGTLHFRAVGVDDATSGLLWSIGVVFEIALC